jgi:hypothetical protein
MCALDKWEESGPQDPPSNYEDGAPRGYFLSIVRATRPPAKKGTLLMR